MVTPTFIGITILACALIHLIPGDPVEAMMGERGVDPVMHAAAMRRLRLDESLPMQHIHYVGRVLHGDLGTSIITNTSVMGEFLARFPATVELSIFAPLIAPHSPIEQYRDNDKIPPAWLDGGNWRFVLGTDEAGRDILSRLMYGKHCPYVIDRCRRRTEAARSGWP